jgi:hypothetical protein
MALERVFCNVTDFIARGMGIKYSISHSAWCALTPEPDSEREVESFCAGARIKFIPFTETTAIGLFLWCSPLCFNFLSCVTQRDKERCSSKACCCGELNSKISSIGGRFALNWGQREFRSRSKHVLLRPLVVKRRVLSAFIRAGYSWVYI